MKLGHFLSGASLALASLLMGCGSSSDSGGDLSPGDGGSGGTGGQYTVVLDGPDCTEPGIATSGYTATLTTRSGAAASGVYVALSARTNPTDATTSVGTIRAARPDGSGTTLNGGTTNTAGVLAFSFTPPSSAIRDSVAISLVARTSTTDTATSCSATGTACYGVELQPTVKPSVSVQGPLVGGARVPSKSLTVESGELAPDFLVTVTRSSSCSSGGRTSGATIAVTPALTGGSVRLVQGTTALDGTASFDYQAPTVSASSAEKLSVVATYNGVASDATVYELTVAPPPPPGSTVVTITGPTTASAGTAQGGYTALVETVETTTSSTGASTTTRSARPNTQLNLSVTNGTVTTQANSNGIGGVTDEFGKVAFSITPSTSSTSNQTLTVTGATVNTNDTVLTSSCALSASRCSTTFQVRVQPDSFQFTAPVFGASGTVGELNAVPLSFQWATSGTTGSATATPAKAGVAGCVNLSATFTGNGTSPYLLKINGDNVPASQTRVVKLDANGNFQVPVAVLSDRSGFVQVTAAENRNCVTSTTATSGTLSATTGVQFVDEICETTADGRNCVDLTTPLRVLTSPDTAGAQRTVDLSFQVLNSAYAPVDGAQVLFRILTKGNAGDPNERVFPGGGTTNASGVATSKYYVPTFTPPLSTTDTSKFVDVQACVRRQAGSGETAEVCSTRRIQIVAPSS